MDHSALRHQAEDTVGIVIYPVKAGSEIAVKDIVTEEISCLTVREDIPIFHKIALSGMVEGQDVVEYGQVIGRATADIPAGGYTKQSLSYESGSNAISFETTTLDGSSTGSSLFSKNRITMVNIWTRT